MWENGQLDDESAQMLSQFSEQNEKRLLCEQVCSQQIGDCPDKPIISVDKLLFNKDFVDEMILLAADAQRDRPFYEKKLAKLQA